MLYSFSEVDMLVEQSAQQNVAYNFELDEEDSPPPLKRLIIEPDPDDVSWAHLRTVLSVCTLQDLPQPLRRRLSSFIEVLRGCNIRRVLFDLLNPKVLRVEQLKDPPRIFNPKTPANLQIGLEMTLWWIEYLYILQVARARKKQSTKKTSTYWLCPECGQGVSSDRDWCITRDCPSWDILVACSGVEKRAPLPGIA